MAAGWHQVLTKACWGTYPKRQAGTPDGGCRDMMGMHEVRMRRVLWWTVVVTAFFLLPVLEFAFPQGLFSLVPDPLAGSRVFGAKGCVKCHAVNDVGGKVGPDLGRTLHPRSFYDLAAAMWNHLPHMVEQMRQRGISRPRLTPQEAADLIAFLFTLHYFDPPGNLQVGQRLFREKKCIVCHQVGGTGGVVGPDLDFLRQYGSPIFVAAAMWNHGPAMIEAMRAKGIERPTFQEGELLDLLAYLRSASPTPVEGPLYVLPGRAEEGRKLFAEKRCLDCHSVGGQGGRVGPDLVEHRLHQSLTAFAAALWNKAPAMTEAMTRLGISLPPIRPEEMADLVAYLNFMHYFAVPADPFQGRRLAMDAGCLGCHRLHGEGGTLAGDLARIKGLDSPVAVLSALWNHSAIGMQEIERWKVPWPAFQPEEMAHIVAFLQSLGWAR
jgi:mono/diheme cytochrome c family protein